MQKIKAKILLNRWKIEVYLKIILSIQIIINLFSFNYPKSATSVLPIITVIEIGFLVLFYYTIAKIEVETLQNLDIAVLEKYISKIEARSFNRKSKNIYLFKLSSYYYLFGKFEKSIALLKNIEFEALPSGAYSALDYYFQAYISRIKMNNWDKIDNIKNHFLSYQSHKMSEYRKRQFYMQFIEIFDTLFVQNKELGSLELPENNPYEYMRNHYLYAINALNQGDNQSARIEFQKIIHFSDKLYMVREAKNWLNNNSEYK